MIPSVLLKRLDNIEKAVQRRAASAIYLSEKHWSESLRKRRDLWNEKCTASGMNRFDYLLKYPAPKPPLLPKYVEMAADPVGVAQLYDLAKERWRHD